MYSITCKSGIIGSRFNKDAYMKLNEFMKKFGFEFGGGSYDPSNETYYISADSPVATGEEQMGYLMKRLFKMKNLVINGGVVR